MVKKNHVRLLVIFLCCIVAFLIYFFPLQRILAQINLQAYMREQGVSEEDILSIDFFKDYTQDGYYASVAFFGDQHRYLYRYYLLALRNKTGKKFNIMICDVYDHNRCLDNFEDGVKYRSLEWK